MEELAGLGDELAVQVDVVVAARRGLDLGVVFGGQDVLGLGGYRYRGEKGDHAQADYLDVVLGLDVFLADADLLFVDGVADLAREERVFVEVAEVGLAGVDPGVRLVVAPLLLLMLDLIGLAHGVAIHHLVVEVHLGPRLMYFGHGGLIKLGQTSLIIDIDAHLIEHLHELLQLLVFLRERSDEFVSFTLVDDGLVLDFLGLVGVTERRKGLLVIVSGGRNGADHQGF